MKYKSSNWLISIYFKPNQIRGAHVGSSTETSQGTMETSALHWNQSYTNYTDFSVLGFLWRIYHLWQFTSAFWPEEEGILTILFGAITVISSDYKVAIVKPLSYGYSEY